jgi:mannose PTS system EIIA component
MEKQIPPRTHIAIVAHHPIASALLALIAHVHGAVPEHVGGFDIRADQAPEQIAAQVLRHLGKCNVLLITDLPGASPHNGASLCLNDHPEWQLISPLTAPLLLRAVNYSHLPIQELYEKLTA